MSFGATTWSPGARPWKIAVTAASPDAKAAPDDPPSSAAKAASRPLRFGLSLREYRYPCGYEPSAARSNVVERWMGGATAPVAASTPWPACTARVSNLCVLDLFMCKVLRSVACPSPGFAPPHAFAEDLRLRGALKVRSSEGGHCRRHASSTGNGGDEPSAPQDGAKRTVLSGETSRDSWKHPGPAVPERRLPGSEIAPEVDASEPLFRRIERRSSPAEAPQPSGYTGARA